MAGATLLGSTITKEVGLRLLLYPLSSNIVIRTACCTIGVALPIYSTFKAIERKNQNEQEQWLVYWAAYGSFSLVEAFSDKILYWFPPYYYAKLAFLVWLQFPLADGSRQLYTGHLRPFLKKHQAWLDQVVGIIYGEIAKFVSSYEAELQFLRVLLGRFVITARQMLADVIVPSPPKRRAIGSSRREGPSTREMEEDSESDHED